MNELVEAPVHIFTFLSANLPVKEGAAFFAFMKAREVGSTTNHEKLKLTFEAALRLGLDKFNLLSDDEKKALAKLDDKSRVELTLALSHPTAGGLTLEDLGAIQPQRELASSTRPQSAPPGARSA